MKNLSILDPASRASFCFVHWGKKDALPQPRTQASSRYPSYQGRLGTECDSANFSDKLDRWRHIRNRRGRLGTRLALPSLWSRRCPNVRISQSCPLFNKFLITSEPSLPSVGLLGLGSKSVSQEKKKHSQLRPYSSHAEFFSRRHQNRASQKGCASRMVWH